jgi:tRNA wybutosine-synthesizing protein 4
MKKKKQTTKSDPEEKDAVPASTDIEVENTNLEANVSKQSLVRKGFLDDFFLRHLFLSPRATPPSPRSPSVNVAYMARFLSMQFTLERRFMWMEAEGERYQVLNCGAGFDTTYLHLRNLGVLGGDLCRYYEVDFPAVSAEKAKIARNSRHALSLCLNKSEILVDAAENIRVGNYAVIGCDLADLQSLEALLLRFGFDFSLPTLVVSECALTYVAPATVSALLKFLCHRIPACHFLTYEQIAPGDRFGQIMKRHFASRQSPLKNVDAFPTLEDQESRLRWLGFGHFSKAISLSDIVRRSLSPLDERRIFCEFEPSFDEWDELVLKCSHYSVAEASNSNKFHFVGKTPTSTTTFRHRRPSIRVRSRPSPTSCYRIGHSCVMLSPFHVLVLGGLHATGGRDNAVVFQSLKRDEFSSSDRLEHDTTLYSAAIAAGDGAVYMFGGRSSPFNASNAFSKLDVVNNTQSEVVAGGRFFPSPRWKHTLIALGDDTLVLVGGKDQRSVFADIFLFSLSEQKWRLQGKLPRKKGLHSHSSSAWRNSAVIVSGGISGHGISINPYLYICRPGRTGSRVKAVLPKGPYIPRFGHTSHVRHSRLFLLGGVADSTEPGLCVVDLMTCTSIELKLLHDIPTEVSMYNHASCLDDDEGGTIFAFGGGGNCFSFGSHFTRRISAIDVESAVTAAESQRNKSF